MDEACNINDGEVPNMKPLLRIGANGVQPVPYTNDKSETAIRNIMPVTLYYGSNEWHPEEQWLLVAWDSDKQALRTFSLQGFKDGNNALSLPLPTSEDLPKNLGTRVPKPKKPATKRRGNRDGLEED
jgi:hypothetical protein